MNVLEAFKPEDIQGNIVRGYRLHHVRYLMLEVADRAAARRFLAASASGGDADVPPIQTEAQWTVKPPYCFNVQLTAPGLLALGVPASDYATFPDEFRDGMASRALKLSDVGDSAPETWPAPFDAPERIHLIASIHSDDPEQLDRVQAMAARAFTLLGTRDGRDLARSEVVFGYVDGISQPKFIGVHDPSRESDEERFDPLGTVLLGYPTRMEGVRFGVPTPRALGFNGSFNAFRVLGQDAAGFERFLTRVADEVIESGRADALLPPGGPRQVGPGLDEHGALREIVAAQVVGRWRNGVPYETSPDTMHPDPEVSLTNFDYGYRSRCPVGSHMRRCNPRGGPIVQKVANYTRRLVRRGMSYGPDFDPDHPDERERGLLGNFLGADLGAQFEAVMYDWLNLGLQHPNLTGSNDPLLGANDPMTSWFDLRGRDGETIRVHEVPRFVRARGGAYTFLPSLAAIRYLGGLTG